MQDRHVHFCIHERMRTVVVSTDKVTICSVSFTSWVSRDGQNPISVSKRAAKTLVHNSTSQKTSWDPVDGFPKANNNVMPRMTVSLQAEEEEEPASKVNQTSSAARRKRKQASKPKERDKDRAREREREVRTWRGKGTQSKKSTGSRYSQFMQVAMLRTHDRQESITIDDESARRLVRHVGLSLSLSSSSSSSLACVLAKEQKNRLPRTATAPQTDRQTDRQTLSQKMRFPYFRLFLFLLLLLHHDSVTPLNFAIAKMSNPREVTRASWLQICEQSRQKAMEGRTVTWSIDRRERVATSSALAVRSAYFSGDALATQHRTHNTHFFLSFLLWH